MFAKITRHLREKNRIVDVALALLCKIVGPKEEQVRTSRSDF